MTPSRSSVRLHREGDVFILDLGQDENRLSGPWVTAVEAALDEVEAAPGPKGLVTVATGKFWSNGLDLEWLQAHPDQLPAFAAGMDRVYARIMSLGAPTVAAIGGHAFAAGAVLALAHDWRVMRADRGYLCLPEADLGLPFPEGVAALVRARIRPDVLIDAALAGRRYGGVDAEAAGLVDHAVSEDQVRTTAVDLAASRAHTDSTTQKQIKQRLFADVLAALQPTKD